MYTVLVSVIDLHFIFMGTNWVTYFIRVNYLGFSHTGCPVPIWLGNDTALWHLFQFLHAVNDGELLLSPSGNLFLEISLDSGHTVFIFSYYDLRLSYENYTRIRFIMFICSNFYTLFDIFVVPINNVCIQIAFKLT